MTKATEEAQAKAKVQAALRNVRVKVLRPHSNHHGSTFQKKKDGHYVHPRPDADIMAGFVEVAAASDAPVKAKG